MFIFLTSSVAFLYIVFFTNSLASSNEASLEYSNIMSISGSGSPTDDPTAAQAI